MRLGRASPQPPSPPYLDAAVTFSSVPQLLPWRARCLFSRTNIFFRLQQAGLGDLAPTRKTQTYYKSWVVMYRQLADTEHRL